MSNPSRHMQYPPEMYFAIRHDEQQGYHQCFTAPNADPRHTTYYHPAHPAVEFGGRQSTRYQPYGDPKAYYRPGFSGHTMEKRTGESGARFVFPPCRDNQEVELPHSVDSSQDESNRTSPMSPICFPQDILKQSKDVIQQYTRKAIQRKKNKYAQREHRARQQHIKNENVLLKQQLKEANEMIAQLKDDIKKKDEVIALQQEVQVEMEKNIEKNEQDLYIQQLEKKLEATKLEKEEMRQQTISLLEEAEALKMHMTTQVPQPNQFFYSDPAQDCYGLPCDGIEQPNMCYPTENQYPQSTTQHSHTQETMPCNNYVMPPAYCHEQTSDHSQRMFIQPQRDQMPYPLQTI